jgi:hypothetical protein
VGCGVSIEDLTLKTAEAALMGREEQRDGVDVTYFIIDKTTI